jgi:hypothetical protein
MRSVGVVCGGETRREEMRARRWGGDGGSFVVYFDQGEDDL